MNVKQLLDKMMSEGSDFATTAGFVPDSEINNSAHDLIVQTAFKTHHQNWRGNEYAFKYKGSTCWYKGFTI